MQKNTKPPIRHLLQPLLLAAASALALPALAQHNLTVVNFGGANGAKNFPKETLEIFGDGRVIRMENFRITTGFGFKGFRSFRTWRQDKGHRAEIAAFVDAVAAGGPPLIPFDEIVNATKASFASVESARTGKVISI